MLKVNFELKFNNESVAYKNTLY